MANALKLAISGATGRMGALILKLAAKDKAFKVSAAFERAGHPALGKDVAEGILLREPSIEGMKGADVIIEFTAPEATLANLKLALAAKKPIVIGTTGLNETQIEKLKNASRLIPVLFSPNMSVGVNLLFDLVFDAASRLNDEYDIEIIEAHHNQKKDAPSGTAKRLAELAAKARNKDLSKVAVYGRLGQTGARPKGQIGILAIRAGDIVGDHTVLFSAAGERLELTHRAHSREAFAKGALVASRYLAKKKPGLYSMKDVLGR